MGNCLVTKLKGVVDNNNLIQLGHYRGASYGTDYLAFTSDGQSPIVSLVSGNAKVYKYEDIEISFPFVAEGSVWYKVVNQGDTPFVLDVSNKYTTQNIEWLIQSGIRNSVPLRSLVSFVQLTSLKGATSEGALIFNVDEEVSAGTMLPQLQMWAIRNYNITGDFAKLPYIFPNAERGCLYSANLTGSVENFIRTWRTIGKVTGSWTSDGWFRNGNITFNGHDLSSEAYDNMVVSWTETTMTITKTNGETETINA